MGGHAENIPKWVTLSCTREIGCQPWKIIKKSVLVKVHSGTFVCINKLTVLTKQEPGTDA